MGCCEPVLLAPSEAARSLVVELLYFFQVEVKMSSTQPAIANFPNEVRLVFGLVRSSINNVILTDPGRNLLLPWVRRTSDSFAGLSPLARNRSPVERNPPSGQLPRRIWPRNHPSQWKTLPASSAEHWTVCRAAGNQIQFQFEIFGHYQRWIMGLAWFAKWTAGASELVPQMQLSIQLSDGCSFRATLSKVALVDDWRDRFRRVSRFK